MSLDQNRYSHENMATLTKYENTGGKILFDNAGLKVFKVDFVVIREF